MTKEMSQSIRATFQLMENLPKGQYSDANEQENFCGASVANIDSKSFFFSRRKRNFTLAIVSKENDAGKVLAQGMIRDVRQYYRKNRSSEATQLLNYSLWSFFVRNIPEKAQVAAFYATFNGTQIQIVSTGMLWAGLFRESKLISSIAPTYNRKVTHLSPLEYLEELNVDGVFDTTPYTHDWDAQEGDIMIVTRADLPQNYIDIVKLAVESAHENSASVSRIVSNLRVYYNVGQRNQDVFAAVQVL